MTLTEKILARAAGKPQVQAFQQQHAADLQLQVQRAQTNEATNAGEMPT